jgi:WD40 repeat protein
MSAARPAKSSVPMPEILDGSGSAIIACFAFPAQRDQILIAKRDGEILVTENHFFRSSSRSPSRPVKLDIQGFEGGIDGCALAPDQDFVAFWKGSGQASTLWTRRLSSRGEAALLINSTRLLCCAFSSDSKVLAAGHQDGSVNLLRIQGSSIRSRFQGFNGPVSSLAFTPDGSHLLAASWDGSLRLWSISEPQLVHGRFKGALIGHQDRVLACAISSAGVLAVSASMDRTLRVWDLPSGEEVSVLAGHTDAVTGCAFLDGGRRVVSCSQDGTLRLWDSLGREHTVLQGHTDWVNAFAMDEERGILYSCSEDFTVRAWDLGTGESRGVIYGTSPFRALTATADGAAAGDEAGNLWLFEFSRPERSPE